MIICNATKIPCSKCKPVCEHRTEEYELRELRCEKCKKLLGRIDKSYKIGYIELKCTRCKTLNKYED